MMISEFCLEQVFVPGANLYGKYVVVIYGEGEGVTKNMQTNKINLKPYQDAVGRVD